ncbi:hypothetical protein TB2_002466 [Malus domestica]
MTLGSTIIHLQDQAPTAPLKNFHLQDQAPKALEELPPIQDQAPTTLEESVHRSSSVHPEKSRKPSSFFVHRSSKIKPRRPLDQQSSTFKINPQRPI